MDSTNKFVIFNEKKEEFLGSVEEGQETNILGWHQNPETAIRYDSLDDAKLEAQRICDNQGYTLDVCELHESDTQLAINDVARLFPKPDPDVSLN